MSIGEPLVRIDMPNVLTLLYTAPSFSVNTRIDIKSITFVNRDEGNKPRIWLYLVESGGVADNSNIIIPGTEQWKVPEGRNIDYDTWKVLKPGATIWGYTDGNVTLFVDGAVWKS